MEQPELWLDDEVVLTRVEQKACTKCKAIKPYDEFYADKRSVTGRSSQCIDCQKEKANAQQIVCRATLDAYHAARGSFCELCHDDFPIGVIHLHHVDPATKTRSMSVASWTAGPKGDVTATEAQSCAALCPNCHMIEHYLLDRGYTSFPSAYSTPDGTKPALNMEQS